MSDNKQPGWLIRPGILTQLIGGDYPLLMRSSGSVLLKHYLAAVCLLVVTIISIVSIFYGVDLLFHVWYLEVFLSVFIALLFGCIYIFLLNTFSKSVKPKGNGNWNGSNVIRFGFVLFMAFLISKPIEVWLYQPALQPPVEKYKRVLLKRYERKLDTLFTNDQKNLQNAIKRFEQQQVLFKSEGMSAQIAILQIELNELQGKKNTYIDLAQKRINRSSYLLYQVQLISSTWQSWVICLIMTALFLLPAYLIYSISGNDAYYKMKKEREQRMIIQAHENFVLMYKQIFLKKWRLRAEVYSVFADPPFNTTKKGLPVVAEQTAFLNRFFD
ncbi:DUF4407 domain-containing protein [Terrimonas sp. NA20]|uniref:DUF4407 domain-containing protein n=1 Tax=Terrimonas ginsenosidimutans TaxID=2908004 RepID=A0ABS9KKA2_9BACT|nr:DUF4407 domain-containing protein [Terrimonas ginsenosidimutans]MCG2612739.1 DUF4407 domain-containing protein [Terrimonas ginsenosidimutans]